MKLSDLKIKNAKPRDNPEYKINNNKPKVLPRKMADGNGLYLLVTHAGKYWRYDFQLKGGKRKTFAIGKYPDISLAGSIRKDGIYIKGARDLLLEAKALVKQGIDPSFAKQEAVRRNIEAAEWKKIQASKDEKTFEVVTREWFANKKHEWVEGHAKKQIGRLERYVFPYIGDIPISELTKSRVNEPIKKASHAGVKDTARRLYSMVRQVLNFGMDNEYIVSIPLSANISSLVPKVASKKMPAITDKCGIGQLLRAIDNYNGTYVVCMALKILPYVSLRPGEFRYSKWDEFDLDNGVWIVPAKHRKLKKAKKEDERNVHIVPLSRQAVLLLRELKQLTGRGNHVFPSNRGDSRPMCENTINIALGSMGYKGKMVGHGFRSIFSTLMNESKNNYNPDAIERQLSHGCKDKVRDAYNRAEYIAERFQIMQAYADYLDSLRDQV